MNRSETISELAKALVATQLEMGVAKKKAVNPYYHSHYADMAEVIAVSRPVLNKHGLAVMQFPSAEGEKVTLLTMLVHVSGEWISELNSTIPGKEPKGGGPFIPCRTPQSDGSAILYLRRYGWQSIIGLAAEDEDDDGEAAEGRSESNTESAAQREESGEWTVPMGKLKGTPLSALNNESVLWYRDFFRKKLAEEPEGKYAKDNKRNLDVLEAEILRRTPKNDTSVPF
jgi:hypothetical protein